MTTAEATAALIDVTVEELGRMRYNDLRALAARAGINAKGDQETLRKRLEDARAAAESPDDGAGSPFKCPNCRRPLPVRKTIRTRHDDTRDRVTRYSQRCPQCKFEAAPRSALELTEYSEQRLRGPLPIKLPKCRFCLQNTKEGPPDLRVKNVRIRTYRDGRKILLADARCTGRHVHRYPLAVLIAPSEHDG